MDPAASPYVPSFEPLFISNAIAGAVYIALIPLMLWSVDRPEGHTGGGDFLFGFGLTYALLSALVCSALALGLTWAMVKPGGVRKVPPAGIYAGMMFAFGGLGWALMALYGAEVVPVEELLLVGASIGIGCVFTGLIWFPLHVVVSIVRSATGR